MLLSDFVGKEIISLTDGSKLGTVGDTDLIISAETGEIESLLLPDRGLKGLWGRERDNIIIPWQAIRKIGSEVIIVDLSGDSGRKYSV